MSPIRVFTNWAGDYSAVQPNLYESVRVPQPEDNTRDERIDIERVEKVLDYLEQYEYATQKHTLFGLLWHTGIRIGTAHGLDVSDFHPRDQYIEVVHRPDDGTPLKNKQSGERPIALDDTHTKLLKDCIDARRHDVTDENGRKPLFTTTDGRAARGTLRKWVYSLARPCVYTGSRPHDNVLVIPRQRTIHMSWLIDYLVVSELGQERARAKRDTDGTPICGGCRNQVNENARRCEHCGAELVSPRRIFFAASFFLMVGFAGLLIGLLAVVTGMAIFGESPIGSVIVLLFGIILLAIGAVFLYPAYRISKDRPVRELNFRERFFG